MLWFGSRMGFFAFWFFVMACGPDPAPGDGGTDAGGIDPFDGGFDAAPACDRECSSCERCIEGQCVAVSEGLGCGGGVCRSGVCCTGCWDGASCRNGDTVDACGRAGDFCLECGCTGDACVESRCVGTTAATAVGAGDDHTCALLADGSAWCFGRNVSGETGSGSDAVAELVPVRVAEGAISVAAGRDFSSVVTGDKRRYAFGANVAGQLGLGDLGGGTERRTPAPDAFSDWVSVVAGGEHACGLTALGRLRCWGNGADGQLGIGERMLVPAPSDVGADAWSDVALGRAFSCAVRSDRTLWCWGINTRSQLGLGAGGITRGRAEPAQVTADRDWLEVTCGDDFGCGVRDPGILHCWGANDEGQLGIGERGALVIPWPVDRSAAWHGIDAGAEHMCALLGGQLWCWGEGRAGQLGSGDRLDSLSPARVGIRSDWSAVSAGTAHTCAIDTGGALYCFGSGSDGRLGNGGADDRLSPTRVCFE
jgi:alpha-tubulin suppressor-like RCC1 family protein